MVILLSLLFVMFIADLFSDPLWLLRHEGKQAWLVSEYE